MSIIIINNVGYNHCHDADFFIDRPNGSGDYLLLLLKTDAIFTIDGKDVSVPKNSFFLYRKGEPQYYRCIPKKVFSNDWIHFDFEGDEEKKLLSRNIPFNTPIEMKNIYFLSFCVKSIAYEAYSQNKNRSENIACYMSLIFSKVEEQICCEEVSIPDDKYEMLSTIRNKIYSKPYEPRSVESTAHEIRMSKSGFQHAYKKYFNTTFIDDLINSRISCAKMLLISTNLSNMEIADQSGYSTYVHFVRQFKEHTGLSPSEYRKRFAQNVK